MKKKGHFHSSNVKCDIFLGICPGNKVPKLENPLHCACPNDSIEVEDDYCIKCGDDVPNEEQSECVGMITLDISNISTFLRDLVKIFFLNFVNFDFTFK